MPTAVARTILASLAILVVPAGAFAAEILVPSYFYPRPGGDWARMEAAASRVPLTAILNPNSGPGKAVDPTYTAAVARLHAAGGHVVAYVSTDYGKRPAAQVHDDMARYAEFYPVDGFFLDEMANDAAHVDHYAALYRHAKSLKATHRVIGNPGTTTVEAYLTRPAADVLVTFESEGSALAGVSVAPWTTRHPADHFAHMLHTVARAETMADDLTRIAKRNVGLVYVTDDVMGNPYDKLPTYWDQEVDAVRASNPPAKP